MPASLDHIYPGTPMGANLIADGATFRVWAPFAEQGNLMTYGPILVDSYHRLAAFADRILKGTKPGDIPVEFPTTVELVVNRKAAQAMGLAVAPSVLARANRVID